MRRGPIRRDTPVQDRGPGRGGGDHDGHDHERVGLTAEYLDAHEEDGGIGGDWKRDTRLLDADIDGKAQVLMRLQPGQQARLGGFEPFRHGGSLSRRQVPARAAPAATDGQSGGAGGRGFPSAQAARYDKPSESCTENGARVSTTRPPASTNTPTAIVRRLRTRAHVARSVRSLSGKSTSTARPSGLAPESAWVERRGQFYVRAAEGPYASRQKRRRMRRRSLNIRYVSSVTRSRESASFRHCTGTWAIR